jgi:hypothetical protein
MLLYFGLMLLLFLGVLSVVAVLPSGRREKDVEPD